MESLFWCLLCMLVYTYAGYPVLVGLWARYAPWRVALAPHRPRVAIVIVVRDEAARVRAKIETCLAQDYPVELFRVVVASDGSTDETESVVRSFDFRRVTWLGFATSRGKAACLNDAIASCDEDVLVMTDARQLLNCEAVSCLVENLADPDVGAVSGELVFVTENLSPFAAGVSAYWNYEKFIRRSEAAIHSVPGVSGALYAVRRACFSPIPPNTVLDDVAIPMQVVMQGRRVVFDGRARAFDTPSSATSQERVRKVRTIAGNFQLLILYPRLLLPWCNPIFLQFLSHKVLRLVAPWVMLATLLLCAALALQSIAYATLLALQLAVYGLPLLGALLPAARQWRLTKIATAFMNLNWFAVLGLFEFLANRNTHLWRAAPPSAEERQLKK